MQGVILYGPPAVGKDTITRELNHVRSDYVLFPRIKVGSGRQIGYRIVTLDTLESLRLSGDVIWENARYKATYIIDRPELTRRLHTEIPVVHLGQPEGVTAVVNAVPEARWTVVELHCPRSIGIDRIRARATGDTEERIAVWDRTPRLSDPHLSIDTSEMSPALVARSIHELRASRNQASHL